MTNNLAIFDWEGSVVCLEYGKALSVQNILHQKSDGNLPVPSAFDLAALYQYQGLKDQPANRINTGVMLVLQQVENTLERIVGEPVSLLFGGTSTIKRLQGVLSSNGIIDTPCAELAVISHPKNTELLPQNHSHISIDVTKFTPSQLLQGSEALLKNIGNARSLEQSLHREEARLPKEESEPVYPGVKEEIEKLKKEGYNLALIHKCDRFTTGKQKDIAALFDYHELCGSGTMAHKPNPVILRNCIRIIGDSISMRINDLIGNTFYICSGYIDLKMALTTQAHGRSIGAIHCLYSADDHRFSTHTALARRFLEMVKLHPQKVKDEKKSDESWKDAHRRLKMQYCFQNLSFTDHPSKISYAIEDLQLRRTNNLSSPLEIGHKTEQA